MSTLGGFLPSLRYFFCAAYPESDEGSLVFDGEEACRIKREHFGTNYGEFKNVIEPFNILIITNLKYTI